MIYFIDIDGTLTAEDKAYAEPIQSRVDKVRKLLSANVQVVLWSARGTTYVKSFAMSAGLNGCICIGKPDVVIDDKPQIRKGGLNVQPPSVLD